MKKILFTILLAFFGVISANAQEIDSLQIKSDTISIESLSAKLDKLQHDYDYLYCEYKLNHIINELDNYTNQITIFANRAMIFMGDARFDLDTYISYKGLYDAQYESVNTFIDSIPTEKNDINLKMTHSNFSAIEKFLLQQYDFRIDSRLIAVRAALEHFKAVLDFYKKLR